MTLPIFDAHCDTVLKIVDDHEDILTDNERTHVHVPALREAGVACQVFACFASREQYPGQEPQRARALMESARALDGQGPFVIPRTAAELGALGHQQQRPQSPERVGVLLALEGGEALGGRPEAVAEVKALGVRYVTLAWGDNELTGSAFGEGLGLSDLGREVVAEMERQRMLVDISHMSDQAVEDTLGMASRPLIASHSSCRALCDIPRNIADHQIRAVADSGGVVGVNFAACFLTEESRKAQWPLFEKYLPKMKGSPESFKHYKDLLDLELASTPRPPLSAIADHVEHIVNVGGIAAAALGSDFDGFSVGPEGLRSWRDVPPVIEMLSQRGFSPADLKAICWDNWARVFGLTF